VKRKSPIHSRKISRIEVPRPAEDSKKGSKTFFRSQGRPGGDPFSGACPNPVRGVVSGFLIASANPRSRRHYGRIGAALSQVVSPLGVENVRFDG